MNAEEVKAQIDAALEPLLQRIATLEAQNKEIRAIIKNVPQPKAPVKTNPPIHNTNSTKKIPPVSSKGNQNEKKDHEKKNEPKVGEEKKQEHNENGQGQKKIQGQPDKAPATQKKDPTKQVPTTIKKTDKPGAAQQNDKKTPQVEKKTPVIPGGRVSLGSDKQVPKPGTKVKTQADKQEEKKEQGHNEAEKKTEHTEQKVEQKQQNKSKQKKGHRDDAKAAHDKDKAHNNKGATKGGHPPVDHKVEKDKNTLGNKSGLHTKDPKTPATNSSSNLKKGSEDKKKGEKDEHPKQNGDKKEQHHEQTAQHKEEPKHQQPAASQSTQPVEHKEQKQEQHKAEEIPAESAPVQEQVA